MAARHEHYAKAESYIAELEAIDKQLAESSGLMDPNAALRVNAARDYYIRMAQLHATLATAERGAEKPPLTRGERNARIAAGEDVEDEQ